MRMYFNSMIFRNITTEKHVWYLFTSDVSYVRMVPVRNDDHNVNYGTVPYNTVPIENQLRTE